MSLVTFYTQFVHSHLLLLWISPFHQWQHLYSNTERGLKWSAQRGCAASLDVFKTWKDKALSNLVWARSWLGFVQELAQSHLPTWIILWTYENEGGKQRGKEDSECKLRIILRILTIKEISYGWGGGKERIEKNKLTAEEMRMYRSISYCLCER